MAANYYVRAPQAAVHNGEQWSGKTARPDLTTVDWAATADTANGSTEQYRCPRGFIPAITGTLVITALEDSSSGPTYVVAGTLYPIAIRGISRTGSAAAFLSTNTVTLCY